MRTYWTDWNQSLERETCKSISHTNYVSFLTFLCFVSEVQRDKWDKRDAISSWRLRSLRWELERIKAEQKSVLDPLLDASVCWKIHRLTLSKACRWLNHQQEQVWSESHTSGIDVWLSFNPTKTSVSSDICSKINILWCKIITNHHSKDFKEKREGEVRRKPRVSKIRKDEMMNWLEEEQGEGRGWEDVNDGVRGETWSEEGRRMIDKIQRGWEQMHWMENKGEKGNDEEGRCGITKTRVREKTQVKEKRRRGNRGE